MVWSCATYVDHAWRRRRGVSHVCEKTVFATCVGEKCIFNWLQKQELFLGTWLFHFKQQKESVTGYSTMPIFCCNVKSPLLVICLDCFVVLLCDQQHVAKSINTVVNKASLKLIMQSLQGKSVKLGESKSQRCNSQFKLSVLLVCHTHTPDSLTAWWTGTIIVLRPEIWCPI